MAVKLGLSLALERAKLVHAGGACRNPIDSICFAKSSLDCRLLQTPLRASARCVSALFSPLDVSSSAVSLAFRGGERCEKPSGSDSAFCRS